MVKEKDFSHDDENERRAKSYFENTKTFIFIATTAVGLTLYVHTVFATNARVDKIEKIQNTNSKVTCLIALEVIPDKSKLADFCDLRINR